MGYWRSSTHELFLGKVITGGAFLRGVLNASSFIPASTGARGDQKMTFDASRCSDRYGSYTEVNPLYNSCKFFIKY